MHTRCTLLRAHTLFSATGSGPQVHPHGPGRPMIPQSVTEVNAAG
jgi:hypothetical protein